LAALAISVGVLWVDPSNRSLRTILFSAALFVVPLGDALLATWIHRRDPKQRWAPRMLVILSGILATLMAAEIVFTHFLQSDTGGRTLSGKAWAEEYWKPINQLGFRDREYLIESERSLQKVVILGDSFAAGWGIADVKDRFSNLLAEKLPENYVVYNLSLGGIGTEEEARILNDFPLEPDVLILSYFMNDIETVALKHGLKIHSEPLRDLNPLSIFLIERSYLLNYLFRIDWTRATNYYDVIDEAFSTETIIAAHKQHLLQIIRHAKEGSAPMIVVMFPFLDDFERSRPHYSEIRSFFADHDIPVVDIRGRLRDYTPMEIMVNRRDVHPNKFVHQTVANDLHEILVQRDIVQK
jgi:lysophospholipase L1-like esterase